MKDASGKDLRAALGATITTAAAKNQVQEEEDEEDEEDYEDDNDFEPFETSKKDFYAADS